MINTSFKAIAPRAAALCAVAALTVAAHADVKVISRVQMAMMGRTPEPQKVTIYYKGPMIRTDVGNTISIVNSKSHQITMLNPTTKTYTVVQRQLPPEMVKKMKVNATAKVTPTNDKKTIAGKPARRYKMDATIDMTSPEMQNAKIHMKINMDQWTTTGTKSTITPGQLTGALDQMLRNFGNLSSLKQITTEMNKIKGLPLSSMVKMDMTLTMPQGQTQNMSMNMQNDVLQLTEAPLPASMFAIPKGYKKTEKPERPMMGGRPGGRGRGGPGGAARPGGR
jgi:hypothetical protein